MRKAQAAMEYLMTYGWAILVIIVVVGALYAMGVFRTKTTVPCSPCFGYFAYVDHNSTYLIVRNGPQEIENIASTGFTSSVSTASAGEKITFVGTVTNGVTVTISYTVTESGVSRSDSAKLLFSS